MPLIVDLTATEHLGDQLCDEHLLRPFSRVWRRWPSPRLLQHCPLRKAFNSAKPTRASSMSAATIVIGAIAITIGAIGAIRTTGPSIVIIGLIPTIGRTPKADTPIITGDQGSASGFHSKA